MKKIIIGLILLTFGICISIDVSAQPPRPPDIKGTSGNQLPGGGGQPGAPIEPGTGILLILAAAYALKKVQEARKIQN